MVPTGSLSISTDLDERWRGIPKLQAYPSLECGPSFLFSFCRVLLSSKGTGPGSGADLPEARVKLSAA